MKPVHSYRRVRVFEGKHGPGDYRVEFAGAAPTHGEVLTIIHWLFRAEDRYTRGLGRRLLWVLIKEGVYQNGLTLAQIVQQADGTEGVLLEGREVA